MENRQGTRDARRAIFEDSARILASEFERPLRIEEVARRVSVSPRQLQRAFSDVGGLGFRSYLRQVRMTNAVSLLTNTDLPVKEVAHHVGYRDPGQFSKAFKRTFGVSPTASRAGRRGP
jgi:AraC family transcriptional regulator, regulatory protein of adaptative response / methylphosphotriester-DNA alkyltransferase methyltransferase